MATKTSQLQIRVSEAEKNVIREAAATAKLELSSYVLSRVLPRPARALFIDLVDQLSSANGDAQRRLALAALNDFLSSLSAADWAPVVGEPVLAVLTPFSANYLAAMVETAAHTKSRPSPRWVRQVPALEQPWFASQLQSLRLYLLLESPPIFRRRNLFVDSSIGARA